MKAGHVTTSMVRGVVVLMLSGLGSALWPLAPVEAMVGLVESAVSTTTTSAPKGVTATCPTNTRVVGATARAAGSPGEVLIDVMRPDAALTSMYAHTEAVESGAAEGWALLAAVTCAAAPVGLELVSATSASTSTDKTVKASCPSGKRLLGSGAAVDGPRGQVILDGRRPDNGLTGVVVDAAEDATGTPASWSVTAYAICAVGVGGLERVSATSRADSADKAVYARCPPGKTALSTAGTIEGPVGRIVLDDVTGVDDGAASYAAAHEIPVGVRAAWTVTAIAVCADAALRDSEVGDRVVQASAQTTSICDDSGDGGRRVSGGGAEVTGGVGQVGLTSVVPRVANSRYRDRLASTASVHTDSPSPNWSLRTHAICITPFQGQTIRSAESVLDGGAMKSVTVGCPSGT